MRSQSTLLCIHREPAQLSLLKEKGYRLITATNGGDGLRLLMSRGADAIILDYHLGLLDGVLDGSVIAAEIKQLRPKLPIVMLADHVELPDSALKSVDALVAKCDGPHFLLSTVHSVLKSTPARRHEGNVRAQTLAGLRRSGRSRGMEHWQANTPQLDEMTFSSRVWRSIRNGSVNFDRTHRRSGCGTFHTCCCSYKRQ
jgi:CheY-like chemotaxis protein